MAEEIAHHHIPFTEQRVSPTYWRSQYQTHHLPWKMHDEPLASRHPACHVRAPSLIGLTYVLIEVAADQASNCFSHLPVAGTVVCQYQDDAAPDEITGHHLLNFSPDGWLACSGKPSYIDCLRRRKKVCWRGTALPSIISCAFARGKPSAGHLCQTNTAGVQQVPSGTLYGINLLMREMYKPIASMRKALRAAALYKLPPLRSGVFQSGNYELY